MLSAPKGWGLECEASTAVTGVQSWSGIVSLALASDALAVEMGVQWLRRLRTTGVMGTVGHPLTLWPGVE